MGNKNNSLTKGIGYFSNIDPESIKGKILVDFVNKLIIGVLAAVVISIVQHQYQEYNKVKEMAFEITKIQTDFVVKYRKELTKTVTEFIALIINKDALDSGKLDEQSQNKLSNLLKQIRITIFHLQAINEQLNQTGEALVQSASTLYVAASSGSSTGSVIETKLKELRSSYAKILQEVKQTTRIVLKEEYEGNDS